MKRQVRGGHLIEVNTTKRLVLVVAILFVVLVAQAYASDKQKPLNLRHVMQLLSADMQEVTLAIALEDWERVAVLAPQIVAHDEPPLKEKVRILVWLGTNAPQFRDYDKQVRQAAEAMQKAAKNKNGEIVIAKFAETQRWCLACHESYRRSFIAHFYGDEG